MSAPALLEIRGLGKRFAQRAGREPSPWVIQDLSFSVQHGELLTLIGPSGAGKSTLLNIIAQIDTATGRRDRARAYHTTIRQGACPGHGPVKTNLVQRRERSRGKGNSRSSCEADHTRSTPVLRPGQPQTDKRTCVNPRIRGC